MIAGLSAANGVKGYTKLNKRRKVEVRYYIINCYAQLLFVNCCSYNWFNVGMCKLQDHNESMTKKTFLYLMNVNNQIRTMYPQTIRKNNR